MITSLRLIHFKNFADETLRVGPFTVIVGANASGKSNIRDAFRFLHGIGRGYTLAEILGGRWGPAGQVEWQSVRGAPNEVGRVADTEPGSRFALEVRLRLGDTSARYHIEVSRGTGGASGFRVAREELSAGGWEPVYTEPPDLGRSARPGRRNATLAAHGEDRIAEKTGALDSRAVGPAGVDPDQKTQVGRQVSQGRRAKSNRRPGEHAFSGPYPGSHAATLISRTDDSG